MTETAAGAVVPATFEEAQDVLAANLPGYTRRAHQMALAAVTEQVIREGRHGLFQAGTGTGKSLVALITAILSGQRTIIATATKALQNQYSGKDLPFLEQYLGVPFTWAVIKGRANYPCHAQVEVIADPTVRQAEVIARVEELSTPDAVRDLLVTDREDFPELTEEEWRPFSISAEECPGKDYCPFGSVCIAERAKARAAQSQVVITNTAYLLRDLSLRDQSAGNVQLLGQMDRVVVDEAHTLPDAARSALEDTIGEGQLVKLSRDMAAYMKRERLDHQLATRIEPAAAALWRQVAVRYADWMEVKSKGKYDPMPLALDDLTGDAYGSYFIDLYQSIDMARIEINSQRAYDDRQKLARTRLLRRSLKALARIEAFTTDSEDKTVRWAQMQESVFRGEKRLRVFLCAAPVQVSDFLRRVLWDSVPTTLISATLAAGTDFSFMKRTVGLREAKKDEESEVEVYDAGTPFDYKSQAMLFVPAKGKPEPTPQNKTAWRAYMQGATRYLVGASGGGALLLYTSRTEMNEAYEALAEGFRDQGLHVMRQGDTTTGKLIETMKADGNAVLFALRTFFEGIDIQGDALRLVVIDKLPFAVPTDLVHQARENALIRERGDKWAGFEYLAIPEMTLVLTQGLGRLIRHMNDRGVMAVLDPRLTSKGYGTKIMRKLPPATVTTDPAEAAEFLRRSR